MPKAKKANEPIPFRESLRDPMLRLAMGFMVCVVVFCSVYMWILSNLTYYDQTAVFVDNVEYLGDVARLTNSVGALDIPRIMAEEAGVCNGCVVEVVYLVNRMGQVESMVSIRRLT